MKQKNQKQSIKNVLEKKCFEISLESLPPATKIEICCGFFRGIFPAAASEKNRG